MTNMSPGQRLALGRIRAAREINPKVKATGNPSFPPHQSQSRIRVEFLLPATKDKTTDLGEDFGRSIAPVYSLGSAGHATTFGGGDLLFLRRDDGRALHPTGNFTVHRRGKGGWGRFDLQAHPLCGISPSSPSAAPRPHDTSKEGFVEALRVVPSAAGRDRPQDRPFSARHDDGRLVGDALVLYQVHCHSPPLPSAATMSRSEESVE